MRKRQPHAETQRAETPLDLTHLRRELRTALELAIVAMAPSELVDRLAITAGLLKALVELPTDSTPVMALVPKLATRARSTLDTGRNGKKSTSRRRFREVERAPAPPLSDVPRVLVAPRIQPRGARWRKLSGRRATR